jgi:hypothetical protein
LERAKNEVDAAKTYGDSRLREVIGEKTGMSIVVSVPDGPSSLGSVGGPLEVFAESSRPSDI